MQDSFRSDTGSPVNPSASVPQKEVNKKFQRNKSEKNEKFAWIDSSPFFLLHLSCILVFWVGFSWVALLICIVSLQFRMFGITGAYHRYFSHRSYKTSRWFQFVLACIGNCAIQKGPLWWAGHHRHHHKYSDMEEDIHSPYQGGFWWSHWGWILCTKYDETNVQSVRDLAKFPELRFLNTYHLFVPVLYGVFIYAVGVWIETMMPSLGTTAWQVFVWGFLVSTVFCYHFTFAINSVAHVFGRKRFKTKDESRNSFLLALITMGEGWHNNHHRYPSSEQQGFYWWEIDFSHYVLTVLSWFGLVWELRKPPEKIYEEARMLSKNADSVEIEEDEQDDLLPDLLEPEVQLNSQ